MKNEPIMIYDREKGRPIKENLQVVKNLGQTWGLLELYLSHEEKDRETLIYKPVRAQDIEEDLQNYSSMDPLNYAQFTAIGTEEEARKEVGKNERFNQNLRNNLEKIIKKTPASPLEGTREHKQNEHTEYYLCNEDKPSKASIEDCIGIFGLHPNSLGVIEYIRRDPESGKTKRKMNIITRGILDGKLPHETIYALYTPCKTREEALKVMQDKITKKFDSSNEEGGFEDAD